jgi:hypothetical protein
MRIMKGGKLVAAIATFCCCAAIVWLSCTKVSSNPSTCIGFVCLNGSFCHVDTITKKPSCICPTGYEGPNCSTASVSKYAGTWNMMQIITGSDSANFNHDTTRYVVTLTNTATPTTFFIDNFSNNPYYNEIICTLDSTDSHKFLLDTISAYHLLYDHYHLLYGSGFISANDSFIRVDLATRHLSATTNWINDTMIFIMTHH